MTNGIEFNWSWLGAYALAGLLGFLGGKVIDKMLAAALKRRFLRTGLRRPARKTIEDTEEPFDLIKDMARKNKLKLSNFDLKRELKRQRVAYNRSSRPQTRNPNAL